MQDSVRQILFLGEDPAWQALTRSLLDAPHIPLDLHRLESLTDLFQTLNIGRAQAIIIDIHAWNFRGLHYVEKVRSQYLSFPVIALYSASIPGLDAKASACGASRSIAFDQLSALAVQSAVDSLLAKASPHILFEKVSQFDLPAPGPNGSNGQSNGDSVTVTFSKNQVITHALNNLLCVISANADLLSDTLDGAASAHRPLTQIKKAARSASALMRHLK